MCRHKMIAALMWMVILTSIEAYKDVPGNPELYIRPESLTVHRMISGHSVMVTVAYTWGGEVDEVESWPPPIEDILERDTHWRRNLHLFKLLKQLQQDIYDENPIENIQDQNNEPDWSMSPGVKGIVQKKWLSKLARLPVKTTQPQNPKHLL